MQAAKSEEARLAVERKTEEARKDLEERVAMDTLSHAPATADGQRTRPEWEVIVSDVWALARAHPACVTIEPRLSEIKALLPAGIKVAGVIAKRVVRVSVTTGKGKVVDI
jgi:hypothetical protein